jgi:hypothetical protein
VTYFTGPQHHALRGFLRGKRRADGHRVLSNAIDHRIDTKFPPCFGGIGQGIASVSPLFPGAMIKVIYNQQLTILVAAGMKPALTILKDR